MESTTAFGGSLKTNLIHPKSPARVRQLRVPRLGRIMVTRDRGDARMLASEYLQSNLHAAHFDGDHQLLVRTNGTAAVATGSWLFLQSSTVGGPGPVAATSNAILGGISAAFDATVASALVFGMIVATSTTNTFTPQGIVWGSWN